MKAHRNILVTGGAGFIGSNFIIYMLDKHEDIGIINLDKLTYAGNLENLVSVEKKANYSFINGDICEKNILQEIFEKHKIDIIVNFAAESHVDRSIEEPDIFIKTNINGTFNLLDTAKKYWQEDDESYQLGAKFIQVSTDEVYGALDETGFFTEENKLLPNSPYSASKASADLLVRSYYSTYKLPVNITRCSNNYGPRQFPEKLIPLIISNALQYKKIPVYGDGLQVRDWLYVDDHCKAIDLVITKGIEGEVYNIGGNNEFTNIEVVKKIINYLQQKYDSKINENLIEYVTDRKGHDRRYAIDARKINQQLGWSPDIVFSKGIEKTIDWYIAALK